MTTLFDIGIAAGMLKEARDINLRALDSVGTKKLGSFTFLGRAGNPEPNSFWDPESKTGFNAIGLRNQGLQAFFENEAPLIRQMWRDVSSDMDLSLAPTETGELRKLCGVLNQHYGALPIRLIEVNAACPNHKKGENIQPVLAYDPDAVETLLMELKRCPYPISLKIAPETPLTTLEAIVDHCIKYGVDTIVSGNTLGSEAVWNGKPVLTVPRGGKSGKPLFKNALKQVASLRKMIAAKHQTIKIEGIGGIFDPLDVKKMREAGADRVSVASLFYFDGGWDAVADLSTRYNLG
jgi:dihydroorotate dehydrogenase